MPPSRDLLHEIHRHAEALTPPGEEAGGLPRLADPAVVDGLLRRLAEVTHRVNERLERCHELLGQGLVSEAISEAEQPPDVLEELLALEAPEVHRLIAAGRERGEPVPLVQAEAVWALNRAYALFSGQPGQNGASALPRLLRLHRLLALGQAPLRDRLRVLRALAQADREHAFWQDDIAAHEKARLLEIEQQANHAAGRGDEAQLARLVHELNREITRATVPGSLRERVQSAHRRCAVQRRRQTLGELTPALIAAHEAGHFAEAEPLARRWREVAGELEQLGAEHEADGDDALRQALAWVDQRIEQRRIDAAFSRGCGELEHALDVEASRAELERKKAELDRYDRSLPEILARQYRSRLEQLDLEAQRAFGLKVAAGGLSVVVLAGVVGLVLWFSQRRATIEGWTQQITQAIAEQRFDAAAGLLERLEDQRPDLRERPRFEALAQDLADARRQRQRQFDDRLAAARSAAQLGRDDTALDDAAELAPGPEEIAAVRELRTRFEQSRRDRLDSERQTNDAFRAELDELEQAYRSLERHREIGTPRELAAVLPEIASVQASVHELKQRANGSRPPVRDALRDRADNLASVITDLRNAAEDAKVARQKIRAALNRLANQPLRPAALRAGFIGFIESFPDSPESRAMRRVRSVYPVWETLHELETFWREVQGKLAVTDREVARQRLPRVQALAESWSGMRIDGESYAPALQTYRRYLQRAERALAADQEPDQASSDLGKLLGAAYIRDLDVLQTELPSPFYVEPGTRPQPVSGGHTVRYYTFDDDQQMRLDSEIVSEEQLVGEPVSEPSPQSQFAAAAVAEAMRGRWESRYHRVLGLLREHRGIDPVLRLELESGLAQLAYLYDWPEDEPIDAWSRRLYGPSSEAVDWLNPFDAAAQRARERARRLLEQAPSVEAAIEAGDTWESGLADRLRPPRLVGMLRTLPTKPDREPDDNPADDDAASEAVPSGRIVDPRLSHPLPAAAQPGDQLLVVGGEPNAWTLQLIGRITEQNRIEWQALADHLAPLTLIWLKRP